MTSEHIQQLIQQAIPACTVQVRGEEGKFEAIVILDEFDGMSRVKRHQRVFSTVTPYIQSGEIHALSIKAFTPSEWDDQPAV